MLTQQRLKEVLRYDPATGEWTWINPNSNRVKAGDAAGTYTHGYRKITVDGKRYYAHRLAWLYMTGSWPGECIDHRDVAPAKNAWTNIREATRQQNQANKPRQINNTSGYKGVSKYKRGKWRAVIHVSGKQLYLGEYDTPQEAHSAYVAAARRYFGQFARAA
jgi:hypothetical protein